MQPNVPVLVNHVTLRMPVLILSIPKYLHELLENGIVAAVTPLCKARRVMVVAVHVALMLVVAVLGSEDGWA
jgi:hypothetical protein